MASRSLSSFFSAIPFLPIGFIFPIAPYQRLAESQSDTYLDTVDWEQEFLRALPEQHHGGAIGEVLL